QYELARAARRLKILPRVRAEFGTVFKFVVAFTFALLCLVFKFVLFPPVARRERPLDERADGEGRGHDGGRAVRRVECATLPVEVVAPSAVTVRASDARVEKVFEQSARLAPFGSA